MSIINDLTIGELREIKKFLDSPVNETLSTTSVFGDSIGKYVLLMCLNYNYYGKIESVAGGFVCIRDAYIVYETGPWDADHWEDAQKLINDVFVNISVVESWQEVEK